ncbi:MAG: siderophore-interacting protein [Lysobacter sp.]
MSATRHDPHWLQVVAVAERGPRMRRVRLAGAGLHDFPAGSEGAHIKLLFPRANPLPALSELGMAWPEPPPSPLVRTYTVAAVDPVAGWLDVDMVLHGHAGPGARWTAAARPGDRIGLIGPGGPPRWQPGADHFVLIGDPSSHALVCAVMAQLPQAARGEVLIEVVDQHDLQPLPTRPGMRVHWCPREPRSEAPTGLAAVGLLATLRALPWPPGTVSVTLAGESAVVVAAREFLVAQRGVSRRAMYAVPYWKATLDEDTYHDERHRIMDAFEAEPA